jgi:hypothetical protein
MATYHTGPLFQVDFGGSLSHLLLYLFHLLVPLFLILGLPLFPDLGFKLALLLWALLVFIPAIRSSRLLGVPHHIELGP